MQHDRRKLVRNALRGAVHSRPPDAATTDGMLEALGDDVILRILELLAKIDLEDCAGCHHWHEQRRATTRDAARFARACWRVRNAMINDETAAGSLYAELLARGATDVVPMRKHRWMDRPYLLQLRSEEHSQHQLRALTYLDEELGFHSASRGGAQREAREDTNRRLARHKSCPPQQVRAVNNSIRELAPIAEHPTQAYAADRIGVYKYDGDEVIATMKQPRDLFPRNQLPMTMRASPDGRHVAFTVWGSNEYGADVRLWLWTPELDAFPQAVPCRAPHESDFPLDDEPAPTAFWWTDDSMLRVAWTNIFVMPSGSDVVGGDPPDGDDLYGFQTYEIEADGTIFFADYLYGCTTDEPERLISVSPDDTGWRLACLVRVSPKHRGETHYKVVVYNHEMREELKHPQVWTGVNPYGKGGYDWGPSAVGMSPAADCIVVMHRTSGSCVTEIFEHVTGARYARINAHNVCDWLRLEADDDRRTGQNVVKLRYKVGFSPCGRFAHVVDQRAYHRHYFEGHAAVVLTLSERRSSPKIPVQGLCHYERNTFDELDVIEQVGLSQDAFMPRPMRELHWGERSMWALAYRGALLFQRADSADPLVPPD